MAHPQQQDFVSAIRHAFPDRFAGTRVLEIGSLDINGSVRRHFQGCDYIGIDVGEGPGVDVVCQGQDYDAKAGSFDVVISCECMEHNPFWRETFLNMMRLCRPGGLVLMTCATSGRPEHGTQRTTPEDAPLIEWDYYKNLTARDFRAIPGFASGFSAWMMCSDLAFCDLFFAGFRAGAPPPADARAVLGRIRRHYWRKNIRNFQGLKKDYLIRIFGEERYMAGSLLPWKA
jgi:SAM-dependent methyltransferase